MRYKWKFEGGSPNLPPPSPSAGPPPPLCPSFVPEHSKAAYALGASYGATYIEPDVISSKDHVLFVMHGNELGRTSDIAEKPQFAERKTTKLIEDGDGCTKQTITGWFAEDFTMDEIKSLRLRATDRAGPFDGIYSFLTFDEMLSYVAELSDTLGWTLGVYPETKLSNYFASINLPLEDKLMEVISSHGYCGYDEDDEERRYCLRALATTSGECLLQSFSPESLQLLDTMTDLTTISLINSKQTGIDKIDTVEKVEEIATYADIIYIPTSFDEDFFAAAVKNARGAGMGVHAWVADDDASLYARLVDLDVDATFTNNVAFAEGVLQTLPNSDLSKEEEEREKKEYEEGRIFENVPLLVAALCCGVFVGGVGVAIKARRGKGNGEEFRQLSESPRNSEAPSTDVLRYF